MRPACALGLAVGALLLSLSAGAADPVRPPHIVCLLADDLGYADVGFNGGREIATPHLDALARGGAVLESFYVQPVCSPTRATLMTGRFVTHHGVYTVVRPHAEWGLPLAERTLAQALREAGYTTAICGKWHLGEFDPAYRPMQRGFDLQYGHWFGAIDYFTHKRDGMRDWYRNDQPCADTGYSTHLIAQEACRIIRAQPADRPLFLYVPFNAVHGPHQVPAKYSEPYAKLKGARRIYAGMVAAMDEAVGQIVAALEETGLRTNTLITFSSDNGGPAPGKVTDNGPLRAGKGTIYEGGIRVCAFATWPGHIAAGQRIRDPLHIGDWYPTLLRLAGAPLEQALPVDGRDLGPLLTGTGKLERDALPLPGMRPGEAALRAGDWKLVTKGERATPELYHLRADPGERKDLAAVEPGRLAELRARLEAFLRDAVPDLRTGLDTESAEGETAGKERRGPAPPRVPAAASDQAASSASVRIRK